MVKRNGFTLIELLVVVAIIGILAAVGVTTFNGFQEKAKVSAVKAMHAQTVKYIITEIMKCTLGDTTAMNGKLNCNDPHLTIYNVTVESYKGTKNLYNSKADAHTASGNNTSYKSNTNLGYIFVQFTSLSKQVMVSTCVKLPCTDVKNQLASFVMAEP